MTGVAASSMVAAGLALGPLAHQSDVMATPTAIARAAVTPTMLRLFESAANRSGVPWEVLAGLAWTQTRDGQQAPEETMTRVAVSEDPPSAPSSPSLLAPLSAVSAANPGKAVASSSGRATFPELVPPITEPGYGLWLLNSPSALSDDPQSVPATVDDLARLMASHAARGDGGMPFSQLRSGDVAADPTVRAAWERIIAGLPIVLQGLGSVTDGSVAPAVTLPGDSSPAAPALARAIAYVSTALCPDGGSSPTILGPAQASEAQALGWYQAQGAYAPTVNGTSAVQLVDEYYRVGAAEGVRADWALVQATLETGGFRSPDTLLNNFAGIAHPDGAISGSPFASVAAGVTAQIQLLKRVAAGNGVPLILPAAPGLPMWGGRQAQTWAGLAGNWASSSEYWVSLEKLHGDLTGTSSVDGCLPTQGQSASLAATSEASPPAPASTPGPSSPRSGSAAPVGTSVAAGGPPSTPPTTAPTPAGPPKTGGPPPLPPPPSPPAVQTVLHFVLAQVGKPWRAGGDGPGAWDASGLMRAAYSAAGLSLGAGLADAGTAVPAINAALPGDLVFASATSQSGELPVGVYRGDGTIIAVSQAQGVQALPVSHWPTGELTVRRIISPPVPAAPSTATSLPPPACGGPAASANPGSPTSAAPTTTALATVSPSRC